ncbi:MAG TPA: hypothetical protein VGJ17_06765 [Candidatus Limnocylindrales bacterium]|jgi:hypothetical protein
MFIDFTGFAGDCLINGKLDLRAPRLTDQLNADPLVHLVDVELEDLENARRVSAPDFTIQRSQLCAVRATGPRGSRALRVETAAHRLRAQIGPYTILGRLHEPPGIDPLTTFAQRDLMVPLTDATIAFMVGGVLDVRDWPTLVINRELASWFRAADVDDAPLAAAPEATPARVVAPGPKVLTLESGDRPRRHSGTSTRGPKAR